MPRHFLRRMPFLPVARKSLSLSHKPQNDALFAAFPVELRVEIFRHCLAYFALDKQEAAPHTLMRVSRAWRTLILNTPQLWSSFSLSIALPTPSNGQRLVSALAKCLERSKGTALSFKLRYPVLDATCTKLFELILSASARWRDVALHAPSASLLSLWEANHDSFPALRSLAVETVGLAPFRIRNLGVDWAKLVTLDLFLITIPTLDDCLHTLQQGVNLASCRLNAVCVFHRNGTEQPSERIALPKLIELQLKLYDGDLTSISEDNLHGFLERVECPRLQSFGLQWNVCHGPVDWSHPDKLVDFLDRMGTHLERLSLAYLPFDTPQIIRALDAVPLLRELHLSVSQADRMHDFVNDAFFLALTAEKALLPVLESITLDCAGESFTNPVLLRFIAARWRRQRQLKLKAGSLEYLEILSPKRVAEYTRHWFRDWKDGKLDVRASLRAPESMLAVLPSYLSKDTYDNTAFLNCDFPKDIRSLLIFDISPK